MAAVYAPDGEVVSPYGFVAGHDALVKMYASFMKPGDKEVDTSTSARMVGEVTLCTGAYTFTPASATSGEKGSWTKVVGKVGGEWKILKSDLRRCGASVERADVGFMLTQNVCFSASKPPPAVAEVRRR